VGAHASVAAESRIFVFRYRSSEHFIEIFRNYYGPVLKAFAALDEAARAALEKDLHALIDEFNIAEDGTAVIPRRISRPSSPRRGDQARRRACSSSTTTSGMVTRKVAPQSLPTRSIWPPWACTSSAAMARPSPVPSLRATL